MVMIKQKYLISSLIGLYIIFFLVNCNDSKNGDCYLESILDVYVDYFEIQETEGIFINQISGWTDSTCIIRILRMNANSIPDHEVNESKYRGIRIFNLVSSNDDTQIDLRKSIIPSKIIWSKTEKGKSKLNIDSIENPENFDEIQVIYNPTKRCIANIDITNNQKFKIGFTEKHFACICKQS